jgi:hypothetical protein
MFSRVSPGSAPLVTLDLADLCGLPGVAAAEPMQHQFAYVGNDLQDLFAVQRHWQSYALVDEG